MIAGPLAVPFPSPLGCANPYVLACDTLVSPAPPTSICSRLATLENGCDAELVSVKPFAAMHRCVSRLLACASVSCCWVDTASYASSGMLTVRLEFAGGTGGTVIFG